MRRAARAVTRPPTATTAASTLERNHRRRISSPYPGSRTPEPSSSPAEDSRDHFSRRLWSCDTGMILRRRGRRLRDQRYEKVTRLLISRYSAIPICSALDFRSESRQKRRRVGKGRRCGRTRWSSVAAFWVSWFLGCRLRRRTHSTSRCWARCVASRRGFCQLRQELQQRAVGHTTQKRAEHADQKAGSIEQACLEYPETCAAIAFIRSHGLETLRAKNGPSLEAK